MSVTLAPMACATAATADAVIYVTVVGGAASAALPPGAPPLCVCAFRIAGAARDAHTVKEISIAAKLLPMIVGFSLVLGGALPAAFVYQRRHDSQLKERYAARNGRG